VIGRRLSHYDVLADLGAGGMGVVYRAHDTRLDRDVAIKILPTDRPFSETARRRFQREAMAASALNHPNIITIYEINSEDNIDFMVMEFVRGVTLSSLLRKRKLGMDEAIRYCIQIADAVAKAHSAGIIHRDLKPGNVMVTDDGLVKVLDFGLAKFDPRTASDSRTVDESTDAAAASEFTLTQPGMITGTVAYMSPEQARGEKVDARSDIFSFGVVMFEVLSGQLPFAGPNTIALLHNLHFNPPRDLSELRPEVPKPLVALIARMLEKEPEKRIQNMAEVGAELRRHSTGLVDGPLTWHPADATVEMVKPPVPLPAGRFCAKRLWLYGAVLLVAVGIGDAGWKYAHRLHPATPVSAGGEILPGDTAYSLYQRAQQNLDHWDREGAVENAIKLGERAIQLDPKSAASYAALGEAYYFKNGLNPDSQWTKLAAQYANRAVALDSYLSTAHTSLGMVEMMAGDSASAEKELRAAADLDPKSAVPHRWLAHLYDKIGKGDEAKKELATAQQLAPNDWQILLELGGNAYNDARYKESATYWERALQAEPDSAQILLNLGAVYHALGRDDDAAGALQRALQIHPTADVYNNLGTIRFYQGRYQDAIPAFEKTVALGANNYDNWASLADAYRWTPGNTQKATEAYGTAIRLAREEIAKKPDQIDLHASLAMYLAKSGNKTGALEEMKRVEQAHSKDPGILSLTSYAAAATRHWRFSRRR